VADLTNDHDIEKLALFATNDLRGPHILVHCAGFYSRGTLNEASIAEFDRLFHANVRGPYLLTQALLPALISLRGQIVFINSPQGLSASAGVGQFGATQHAMKAFADSLRDEVNPSGVRVLSVYPGRTATPRMDAIYREAKSRYEPEVLLQPDDIAAVVLNALSLARTAEVTNIMIRPMLKTY